MYISSSLPPLSLPLLEASVSYSFPSLLAKQSPSNSIPSWSMYFARRNVNCCGCGACCCGGGDVSCNASSLQTGFYIIGAFRFKGFTGLSGNCSLLTLKMQVRIFVPPWSAIVNLHKKKICVMLVLVRLMGFLLQMCCFTLSWSSRIDWIVFNFQPS